MHTERDIQSDMFHEESDNYMEHRGGQKLRADQRPSCQAMPDTECGWRREDWGRRGKKVEKEWTWELTQPMREKAGAGAQATCVFHLPKNKNMAGGDLRTLSPEYIQLFLHVKEAIIFPDKGLRAVVSGSPLCPSVSVFPSALPSFFLHFPLLFFNFLHPFP
jgi:hypothetical protein